MRVLTIRPSVFGLNNTYLTCASYWFGIGIARVLKSLNDNFLSESLPSETNKTHFPLWIWCPKTQSISKRSTWYRFYDSSARILLLEKMFSQVLRKIQTCRTRRWGANGNRSCGIEKNSERIQTCTMLLQYNVYLHCRLREIYVRLILQYQVYFA